MRSGSASADRGRFVTAAGAFACAVLLHCGTMFAANLSSELVIRSWGVDAGLPQNTVNSVVQTKDGYLWLGTRDGLARFDGVRFRRYGLADGLPSVEVQVLFVDRAGVLWIGTSGGGVSRFTDTGIIPVPFPPGEASGDIVTSFAQDAAGRLWIGTRGGLQIWTGAGFTNEPALATIQKAPVSSLLCDRRGRMWIATASRGLYEFADGLARESKGPPGNEHIAAYCLLQDQSARLWASVGNGVLLCHDGERWGKYDETNGVPYAYVTCLTQESNGTIWAGSLDQGLFYLENDRFWPVSRTDGLSADDVRSLSADREGNLWAGTRTAGLNRISHRVVTTIGWAQGLTNEFTRSVAETPDGKLWIGTTGGGLYTGSISNVAPFRPAPVVSTHPFVETVLSTRDGLWWGGSRALFCWRDGELAGIYTNEPWVLSASVTALCEASPSGLWIGTSEGRLIRRSQGGFVEFPRGVARGAVTALAQDPDGALWVGSTAGGLRRVMPDSQHVVSITNGMQSQAIRSLYLDRAGALWIGTAGGGLARFFNGRAVSITGQNGLGVDAILQVLEDDSGSLWLGTIRGILRVSKREAERVASGEARFLYPQVLGTSHGMAAEECSSGFHPSAIKLSSGALCFPTVKGLVLVDPRQQIPALETASPIIEEATANGTNYGVGARPGRSNADPAPEQWPPTHLDLPSGSREIEFHYTAVHLRTPEQLRFRYQLKGFDPQWIEAGNRRSAFYSKLPAGQYEFQVAASGGEEQWSLPTVLDVRVKPFLWERKAFKVASILVGLVLFAGFFRILERRTYRRKLARLETQHAIERERLRISQDMHDHIGSILTQVSLLSELGQSEKDCEKTLSYFDRIALQVRSAVQALDEIIWATNPRNDNLPRFAEYVSRFADECFESSRIRCWQEMPDHLPDLPLSAEVRHNVFLAIKEALNNVLKHSRATEVWLRLTLEEAMGAWVTLTVQDNGCGFARDSKNGNGLANMRARLAECRGKFSVVSTAAEGTKVVFAFPLSGSFSNRIDPPLSEVTRT